MYYKRKAKVFGGGALHLAAVARMLTLLPLTDDGGVREEMQEPPRELTPVEAANMETARQRRATLERRRSSVLSRLSGSGRCVEQAWWWAGARV